MCALSLVHMRAAKYLFIPNVEPPMPMYVVENEPAAGDFELAAWSMLQIIRISDRHRFESITGWGNLPFSMSEFRERNDAPSSPSISIAASSPTGLWRPLPPDFELPLNLLHLPRGVLEDYHYEVDAGNVHVHPDFYRPCPW